MTTNELINNTELFKTYKTKQEEPKNVSTRFLCSVRLSPRTFVVCFCVFVHTNQQSLSFTFNLYFKVLLQYLSFTKQIISVV